ncbi:MAG: hypothetical protein FVQ80_10180 [Planctomycetes bacterium]|nr:hypothetical protein [Planctomycetota bacterium]
MTSTVSELLRITKDLFDYCLREEPDLEILSGQRCSDKLGQQVYIKVVYNIILELAPDSLLMIEKKRYVSSATLLRSLFEYYIELLFLAKHPENYKQRGLDAKRGQQKILNTIETSPEPCLAKLKTDSRFEPKKDELSNDLNGYSEKRLLDICNELGLNWMYNTVYRCLSPVAHPSLINYENRYFEADPSGKMIKYDPAPQLNEETAIERLVLLSNILVGSTECIHHTLPNCNASVIDAQLEKFVSEMKKATPSLAEDTPADEDEPKKDH